MARLQRLGQAVPAATEADTDATFVERIIDALFESAEAGSRYTELRFGTDAVLRPGFMRMFRQAEDSVRRSYPRFRAEAVINVLLWYEPRRLHRIIDACEAAADEGLAGIDLLHIPYAVEADWRHARHIVESARDAGLGVTVHAGEFSTANIEAVASIEGVTRIGHATRPPTTLDCCGLSSTTTHRRGVLVCQFDPRFGRRPGESPAPPIFGRRSKGRVGNRQPGAVRHNDRRRIQPRRTEGIVDIGPTTAHRTGDRLRFHHDRT